MNIGRETFDLFLKTDCLTVLVCFSFSKPILLIQLFRYFYFFIIFYSKIHIHFRY